MELDEDIEIVRVGLEAIDDLGPLWQALHEHHAAVAPDLQRFGAVRTAAESWEVRRALYEEWLADPESFALIALERSTGASAGYALVTLRSQEETWATGRVAELQTLLVLPQHRDAGLGRQLVESVYAELGKTDCSALSVSVIASNSDAIRFYEGLGMTPFLQTFLGSVPPGSD